MFSRIRREVHVQIRYQLGAEATREVIEVQTGLGLHPDECLGAFGSISRETVAGEIQ